ncbi:hypothetical protein PINS_up008943 [Pythium insidiosum]|nr:hypothetical protein PINS_up008943 [Pythium insidiosum]
MFPRLKAAVVNFSTNANFYIPLLGYVSNIPIKETPYFDPSANVESNTKEQQFALPSPP